MSIKNITSCLTLFREAAPQMILLLGGYEQVKETFFHLLIQSDVLSLQEAGALYLHIPSIFCSV